jgi:hypothetical protein
MTEGVLSLTKHYVLDRLVDEIAQVKAGMTPDEVRSRLQSPHKELFDDLFLYDESGVVDSVLMEICRSGSPGSVRVVWVALVSADHRLQHVVTRLLTSRSGKLRRGAFSTDAVERALPSLIDSPSRKAASNLLHYFEQARIVVPEKHGGKIVGIETELDTRSAVPLSVAYLAERFQWTDPLRQALDLRANGWLNLTAGQFSEAFATPNIAVTSAPPATGGESEVERPSDEPATIPELDHPYRDEDESAGIRLSGIREFDPDTMERASRSHRALQNKVARWLRDRGVAPISPTEPPFFDVGWWDEGVFWIVEVKSLHAQNESHQIRLGLGQVLDYAHQLARRGVTARAGLAVEREPIGHHWVELCRDHGVILTWPPFTSLSGSNF